MTAIVPPGPSPHVHRTSPAWGRAFGRRVLGLALLEAASLGAFAAKVACVFCAIAARLFAGVALLLAAAAWFGHEPRFLGAAAVQSAVAAGLLLLRAVLFAVHDRLDMAGLASRRSGISFHSGVSLKRPS